VRPVPERLAQALFRDSRIDAPARLAVSVPRRRPGLRAGVAPNGIELDPVLGFSCLSS